jgi:uncharacterized membrane protein (DUF106 family)
MEALNSILRAAFDTLLRPIAGLDPAIGVALVSLLAAVLVLLVFRRFSDQPALAAVKRQVHAGLFELRLFADDPPALLAVQRDLLRHNLRYLRLSLLPMAVMIVPFVLAIAQLQFHWGYRALAPGETALLEVELDPAWRSLAGGAATAADRPDLRIEVPAGLRVETPGVWARSRHLLTWRLGVVAAGSHTVTLSWAGTTITKSLDASERVVRRSPFRRRAAFLDQLLYPAEPPLPAGTPLRAIVVTCPPAEVAILGLSAHWLVWFFVLTMAFAFALRRPLGVTF